MLMAGTKKKKKFVKESENNGLIINCKNIWLSGIKTAQDVKYE